MKKFMLLYSGPATGPDASHAGWPEWFQKVGDNLVDKGSPMMHGLTVRPSNASESVAPFNGYSIIQAEDSDAATALAAQHPYVALGDQYRIEMFEIKS